MNELYNVMDRIFTIEGIEYPRFINSKVAGKIINFENLIRKERTLRSQQKDIDHINLLNDLGVISFGLKQVPIMTPYTREMDYILVDYLVKDKSLCIFHEDNYNHRNREILYDYGFESMRMNRFKRTMKELKTVAQAISKFSGPMADLTNEYELDLVNPIIIPGRYEEDIRLLEMSFPEIIDNLSGRRTEMIELRVPIHDMIDIGIKRSHKSIEKYSGLIRFLRNYNIELVIGTKNNKI